MEQKAEMTQVEFESKLREMNHQKAETIRPIAMMQLELKEEIAAKNRTIKALSEDVAKLKQQRVSLAERRMRLEGEWSKKINKFITDNQNLRREWDEISTYIIVKELRRRGWGGGQIHNDDPDVAEEHKRGVIAAFNGNNNQ